MAHKLIEVAYMPEPAHSYVMSVRVPSTFCVADILDYLNLEHEGYAIGQLGRRITLETVCAEGTRIDVVCPLLIDPKQMRKARILK